MPWIGIDFDGTLSEWGEGTSNPGDVLTTGDPIPAMIDRVKGWIAEGKQVRIFTARVGPATPEECHAQLIRLTTEQAEAQRMPPYDETLHHAANYWFRYQQRLLSTWSALYLGVPLLITASKDFHMEQLWDDRCVQVEPNTGECVTEALEKRLVGVLGDCQ